MKLIMFVVVMLSLFSCKNKTRENIKTIQEWHNKEIIFPLNLNVKVQGKDTVAIDFINKKYKVLKYIDSTGCTSCKLKLYEWKLFMEEAKNINNNLSFIYIAHLKDYTQLESIAKENLFNYPIFYDPNDEINKLNNFPSNSIFHTFLLDKNNKVILIGDPLENKSIWDIYKKTLSNKNSE